MEIRKSAPITFRRISALQPGLVTPRITPPSTYFSEALRCRRVRKGTCPTLKVRAMAALTTASAPLDQKEASEDSGKAAVVFTTPGCPFCRRAKNVLKEKGIEFQEVDVSVDPKVRSTVAEVAGRKTVPVLYINGVLVGGADDLDQVRVICCFCCKLSCFVDNSAGLFTLSSGSQ
jgi:glutaredoxin 3